MNAAISLKSAREMLAAHAPGIVMRKAEGGEYRVTFSQAAIAAAFPEMSRAELIEKAEALACYESDIAEAYESGKAMYRVGLKPEAAPVSCPAERQPLPQPGTKPDYDAAWSQDDGWQKPASDKKTRRDNVEYHNGKAARLAGDTLESNPYMPDDCSADSRFERWNLGWREAEREAAPVRAIDATPSWAGILPLLRLAIESGTAEGRAIAWEELARMAGAADKWNAAAKAESA